MIAKDPLADFDKAFQKLDERFKRQFNDDQTKFERTVKRGVKVVVLLWALGIVGGLAIACGAIYVAMHFIAKAW